MLGTYSLKMPGLKLLMGQGLAFQHWHAQHESTDEEVEKADMMPEVYACQRQHSRVHGNS